MFKTRLFLLVLLISMLITTAGCSVLVKAYIDNIDHQPSMTPIVSLTATVTPFPAVMNTYVVIPPSYTSTTTPATPVYTPSATFTPIPTDTPAPAIITLATGAPPDEWTPIDHVIAPILLYHHVSNAESGNRYYVSVNKFRAQIQALRDWGYETITPSQLVDALIIGVQIPERPVIITFDDGNLDIYQNAFPIMKEMGFVGTFYIVADTLQYNFSVNAEQLQELAENGWEIGSHGMTHKDLTLDHSIARYEVQHSRVILQEITGEGIDTFAYPYGNTDDFVSIIVSEYGYRAGMSLGFNWDHSVETLYDLDRMEVQGDYSINTLARLLPWSDG